METNELKSTYTPPEATEPTEENTPDLPEEESPMPEDALPETDGELPAAEEELSGADVGAEGLLILYDEEGKLDLSELSEETLAELREALPDLRIDLFPLWIGLGVLLGILLGAAAMVLTRMLFRRKKSPKAEPVSAPAAYSSTEDPVLSQTAPLTVQVSKLHEQGARSSQQDSFAVSVDQTASKGTLAVVCDGMGGLKDGDKVSQTAVSAVLNGFLELDGVPDRILLGLLARANRAVNHLLGPTGRRSSGTTMVAGILKDDLFSYLSVGDSRISLLRDGELTQLNREHIFYHELAIDAINDQRSFREVWDDSRRGALTSFIGMGELKYIDVPPRALSVRRGDKLVLMTDGVYNALTEEELKDALLLPTGEDTAALGAMIAEKHYAQQDNYTAVVLTIS